MTSRKSQNCLLYAWLLCFVLLSSHKLSSQNNCPFIWPLDGGVCSNCVPSGWESELTADIVNGLNWFVCDLDGYGQSPQGGNSVLLYGTNNNSEAIITLVGGLTPGVVYNIAFYWTQAYTACPGGLNFGGGDLLITIDGNVYEFSGADDWELAEICYTAENVIAEIHITLQTDMPGVILVDSAICEELQTCCELKVDVNNNITLCPGDEFIFDGSYSDEQGAVIVEWTSEPDDGVDFLDDRFSLNPTFVIPDIGDYNGESYRFKLTITDAACERDEEFLLVVTPSEVPEFEIDLCEVFGDYELPFSSLDPYTGTWEGDFDFASLGGTFQEYTFTLDDDQNNCVESEVYELYITEAEPVIFALPESYCGLDSETYFIEFTSDNGVAGTWDIDGISPDDLSPDFYTYTFVPDPELHCAYDYIYIFEVKEPDSLTFNIPSTFCIVQDNYILPTISLEGIQGDWNVTEIDVSTVGINYEVEFIAEEVQDCYYPYVHTYEITTSIQNSFSIPTSICSTNGEYQFPVLSDQGYEGIWTPAVVNFDSLNSNTITSTWQPIPDQSDCLIPSSQSINIEQAEILNFNLSSVICRMSPSFVLPLSNLENTVTGQWNEITINPNLLNIGVNVFEFTPDAIYCAENYIYTVNIVEEFEPTFNLVTGFCPSQPAITLPTISQDGYTGAWTIPVIEPSIPGTVSIQSTFVPDQGQANCLDNYTETFTIDLLIDPAFDIPEYICSNDFPYALPEISNNGVPGLWSIQVLDSNITDQVVSLIFTPDDLSCYNVINTSLEIIQLDLLSIDFINASDCNADDGSIIINNPIANFEYSIDDGVTWQTNNIFDNLDPNNYQILARPNILQTCIQAFDAIVNEPDLVQLTSIESDNISNCTVDDGRLTAFASLPNVEYSIDDGASWQVSNVFENLSSGSYSILVRNALGISCQDTLVSNIEDFPVTQILMIDSENITECEIDNGTIEVFSAEGQDLEYSINGTDWQNETDFENMAVGIYIVYARSSISPDCIDSISVELVGPDVPMIVDVLSQNTNDCQASDGSIKIDAIGSNLEYSVDDGITWQDDSLFEFLIAGIYNIVVREKGTTTCLAKTEVTISDPEPFVLNEIETENVTTCFPNIGSINVIATSIYNLEYSIDEGLTWQAETEFNNLENGEITVSVRPIDFINCEQSQVVNIELLPQEIELIEARLSQPSDCVTRDASIEFVTDIGGLEYSIDNGSNWQLGNIFNNIPDGLYTAIIRKPNTTSCEITHEFEVKTPPCPCNDLVVDVNVNHVTCEDINSGNLEILNIEGAYTNDDINILWSNGVSGESNQMLASGRYTYDLNYDKNCVWSDSIYIEDFDLITFGLLSFDKTCTEEGHIEVVDFMGGNGEYNFSIDEYLFQEESVFYNLDPGQYMIYVMDQLGCQESESITLNSNLDLSLDLNGIDPIIINQSTFLNPLINQSSIDSFEWYPEVGILNPGELVANVAPRETTEYTLTIYYGECIETRSIVVQVIDNRKFYVANIISLSDDNNNILFLQGGEDLDVAIHNFNIYDRWGNKVFAKENVPLNDRSYGWNGYFNGKKAIVGVYTYYINYTLRGTVYKDAGTLTLIR